LFRQSPHVAIYASDEGFGHIVRQEAIIREILARIPDARITVQTSAKLAAMKEKLGDRVEYRNVFNNVLTVKTLDGALDRTRTLSMFREYEAKAGSWIRQALDDRVDFDFCISDFVPEAFELARVLKRPSFGVAHFTWDWFFMRLEPPDTGTLATMEEYIDAATRLYFPPLTPRAILEKHRRVASEVAFIINEFTPVAIAPNGMRKCLIMDNGTNTLARLIGDSVLALATIKDVCFYLAAEHLSGDTLRMVEGAANIVPVRGLKNLHSHIPKMDFIIARGGFNTLTECLISKIPSMLVEEGGNPEVSENIRLAAEGGYTSAFSTIDFGPRIAGRIRRFIDCEYDAIKSNLNAADFPKTGPAEVISDILNRVEAFYGRSDRRVLS